MEGRGKKINNIIHLAEARSTRGKKMSEKILLAEKMSGKILLAEAQRRREHGGLRVISLLLASTMPFLIFIGKKTKKDALSLLITSGSPRALRLCASAREIYGNSLCASAREVYGNSLCASAREKSGNSICASARGYC